MRRHDQASPSLGRPTEPAYEPWDDGPSLADVWQEDIDTELPAPRRVARGEVTAPIRRGTERHAGSQLVAWAVGTGAVVTLLSGLGAAAWTAFLG